jgi:TolA-binding protein
MFSRKKQARPLKAVPLKFVNQGENLDVANSIMSVEMSALKPSTRTPKISRRKASTMSSTRRSASIERIFEKQKSSEEKVKQELQKQLQELRQKEQELKYDTAPAKVAANLPPPPPPPPIASLPIKPREIKPSMRIKPCYTLYSFDQSDIQDIRSKLRKVNREPVKVEEEKKTINNMQDDVIDLLKKRMVQIRSHLVESDDDSSDDSSESSSSEEF